MAKFKIGDTLITKQGSKLTILNYKDSRNVTVEFNDEHKYQCVVASSTLEKGLVKNPFYKSIYGAGYIGHHRDKTSNNGVMTTEYYLWKSIVQRCYHKKFQDDHPAYSDCTMHHDWLCFSYFYDWCSTHDYFGIGYHLDKDLLIEGNKHYSPETCCFVPQELNNILLSRPKGRGSHPQGVTWDKQKERYYACVRIMGKTKNLGYFDTPEEAFKVYKIAKEAHVKRMANHWQDRIADNVFQALTSWTLDN